MTGMTVSGVQVLMLALPVPAPGGFFANVQAQCPASFPDAHRHSRVLFEAKGG